MDISRLEEVVREIISSYDNRSPLPDSISYLEEKLEEVREKLRVFVVERFPLMRFLGIRTK
jgi:hypothetical protein